MSEQGSKVVTQDGQYGATPAGPDFSSALTLADLERAKAVAAELLPRRVIESEFVGDVLLATQHYQWCSAVAKVSGEVEALVDSGGKHNA